MIGVGDGEGDGEGEGEGDASAWASAVCADELGGTGSSTVKTEQTERTAKKTHFPFLI